LNLLGTQCSRNFDQPHDIPHAQPPSRRTRCMTDGFLMISARNNAAGHCDSGWGGAWGVHGGCFHIDHIVKHRESLLKLRFGLLLFFLYWTQSVELDKLDIIGPHYSNPISSTHIVEFVVKPKMVLWMGKLNPWEFASKNHLKIRSLRTVLKLSQWTRQNPAWIWINHAILHHSPTWNTLWKSNQGYLKHIPMGNTLKKTGGFP